METAVQNINRLLQFYKFEIILILFFLITRLINLDKLPIFNDEAIYLDWGWKEIHYKGELYFSLFDGKQPMLMWVFGIFQNVFKDPLIAGRVVSVITGFITLIGIYLISRKIFNPRIAYLSSLLYVLIPIFIFFDRQALMESTMSTVGVWLFFFFILNISNPRKIYGLLSGILVGVGLFVKSNAFLFVVAFVAVSFYAIYNSNKSKFKLEFFVSQIIGIIASFIVLYPLTSQRDFGKIIEMNSRYAYSLSEILGNFQQILLINLRSTSEILLWYLNPIFLILVILGLLFLVKDKIKYADYLIIWIISTLSVFLLFTKNSSPRYIVSILPLLTLLIGFGINKLWETNKKYGALPAIGLYMTLYLAYTLVISPISYFYIMGRLTPNHSIQEYVQGWTSGYGVKNAYELVARVSEKEQIKVVVRSDSGNPESAIFAYTNGNENIITSYLDFDCNNSKAVFRGEEKLPAYFITRGLQFEGREKCLKEIKKFYKPYGNEFVGVYKINQ